MRRAVLVAAVALAAAPGCAATAARGGAEASFRARQEFTITPPAGTRSLRGWFSLPQNDPDQVVSAVSVACPHPHRVVPDDQGNWHLYVEAEGRELAPFEVVEEFTVTRREVVGRPDPARTRPLTAEETRAMAAHLGPHAHVPVDGEYRRLALEITGGDRNPVSAARKLYDWTLDNVEYWVKHPDRMKASPVGSAEYCLDSRTGNCTDFHSLWTALARGAGIPTRMVYGSFFKKDLAGKDADQSYHCWIEFWAPELGWIVHDVAVADLFVGDFALNDANREKVVLTTAAGYSGGDPAMVDYYFGSIDERRVVWHRGRDLRPDPAPAAGPLNMLPKAWVEADGKPLAEKAGWTRRLTFEEIPAGSPAGTR